MPKLNWDGNDFRNSQDSSGTVSDNISRDGNLQQGYEHGSITRGLVAYYPMEKGEGEILHDGALDNVGQIISGASGDNVESSDMWTSNSNVGLTALDFDGVDDYIDLPLLSLDSFTIALHFYPRENANRQSMINNYGGTNSEQHFKVDISGDGNLEFFIDDGSTGKTFIGNPVTLNEYNFALVSYDRSKNEIMIYQDGDVVTTSTYSGQPPNFQERNTFIGKRRISDIEHFNGIIDDVRVYNRNLSRPEMDALANISQVSGVQKKEENIPSQSNDGISHYKLNGDASDSWSSNNGTNNGADLTSTGVYGNSGNFDSSTNDNIDLGSAFNFGSDNYAIAAWIKTTGTGSFQAVVSDYDGGTAHYNLGISNGKAQFFGRDSNGDDYSALSENNVETGEWVHIAGYREGYTAYIFVNGKLDGKATNSNVGVVDSGSKDWIGARIDGSSSNYEGKIDDVRIYSRALTPLQIEKLYHKGAYRIPRRSTLQ